MEERIIIDISELKTFVIDVLGNTGLSREDAEITADVLISADRRNIESHGVARLKRYVDGIKTGIINPDARRR